MCKKLFIIGTGTEIGKSYVSARIVKKLHQAGKKVAYFKAAMSGNKRRDDGTLIPGDALYVKEISGISQPLESMCPYVYEKAVSPHLAAKIERRPVSIDVVRESFDAISSCYDYVVIEGSGGIICPLRFDEEELMLEDVLQALAAPALIVAEAGLGTINHVVLTDFYMKAKKIPIKGILLNHFHPGDWLEEDNRLMCEYVTGERVISCIKEGDEEIDLSLEELESLFE